MITCCKDCTERHLGCHSKCEKYINQKKEAEKIKEKRIQENNYSDASFRRFERIHRREKHRSIRGI